MFLPSDRLPKEALMAENAKQERNIEEDDERVWYQTVQIEFPVGKEIIVTVTPVIAAHI